MANLLSIQKAELERGVWALSLRGSVDASNVGAVVAAAGEVLEAGARHVLMDLRKAEYVSSAGFSAFLKVSDRVAENGGKTIFVSTPPKIMEVFKILGLDSELIFAQDAPAGLGRLKSLIADSTP